MSTGARARRGLAKRRKPKKYWRGPDTFDRPEPDFADYPPSVAQPTEKRDHQPAIDADDLAILTTLSMGNHIWRGQPFDGGMTTGQVASTLGLKPRTSVRQAMQARMTRMRKRGLLHYEFDRLLDREVVWWVTPQGVVLLGLDL